MQKFIPVYVALTFVFFKIFVSVTFRKSRYALVKLESFTVERLILISNNFEWAIYYFFCNR